MSTSSLIEFTTRWYIIDHDQQRWSTNPVHHGSSHGTHPGSCLVRTRFRFGVHICAFLCSRPVFRCAHLVVPVLVMVHNWSISILVTNPQLTPKWGSKMGSKSGQICHTNKQVFPSQKGPPEVLREHDSLNSESRLPPPDPENGPILDPFFGHFWRFWPFLSIKCMRLSSDFRFPHDCAQIWGSQFAPPFRAEMRGLFFVKSARICHKKL